MNQVETSPNIRHSQFIHVYFEANPRHHSISSVNILVHISKLQIPKKTKPQFLKNLTVIP